MSAADVIDRDDDLSRNLERAYGRADGEALLSVAGKAAKNFHIDDGGAWNVVPWDGSPEAHYLRDHPWCAIDAPGINPSALPSLPFPFTGPHLAAFLMCGAGVLVEEAVQGVLEAAKFGTCAEDKLEPQVERIVKELLQAADHARSTAEAAIGPLDDNVAHRAAELEREYDAAIEAARQREGVPGERPDGMTTEHYWRRRDHAKESVKALDEEKTLAQKEANEADTARHKAIIRHLLRTQGAEPALIVANTARSQAVTPLATRPPSACSVRQDAIVMWLRNEGLDPACLPRGRNGMPTWKTKCRDALTAENQKLFFSANVFGKAWLELLRTGRIKQV